MKKQDHTKNTFLSSTHKLCIKYGNKSCNFVGNSKLKPIDYDSLFNIKEHSAALTAIIGSNNVSKTNNKASTASSTSVKYIYDEVSVQIAAVTETQ